MSAYLIAHVGHTGKMDEHICWWKPESRGYTICLDKAGLYTESEARSICERSECIAVPLGAVAKIARTTPYFRRSDGTLKKLYDGGPHRPVENSAKAWASLKEAALLIGCYAAPTPITPSKARAIYLEYAESIDAARAAQEGKTHE